MIEPYYQHAGITIYHGDCREILPELEPVDLVLTDPPWNLNFFEDDNKPWQEYANWLESVKRQLEKSASVVWIFQSTKAIGHVGHLFKDWQSFASVKNFCQMTPSRIPNAFDIAFFNSSKNYTGRGRNWHIGNNADVSKSKNKHPTNRPIDTIKFIIGMYDLETILDPFMGSGTTLRAAKDLGRQAIGIEIEEKYCEIAANRLRQEVLAF